MYPNGVLVMVGVLTWDCGGWALDLSKSGVLSFDSGISFRIDSLNKPNGSFFDSHTLRMDYSGYGVSLGKQPEQNKLQIGLYLPDQVEGRAKKMGELILPILMGVKATSVGALMMAGISLLILKAFMVGKTSLLILGAIGFYKLFGSHKNTPSHSFEPVKYVYPVQPYLSQQPTAIDYGPTGAGSFDGYANYIPSAHEAAESTAEYAVVAAPTTVNATQQAVINLNSPAVSFQRREFSRRKSHVGPPHLKITKYSART